MGTMPTPFGIPFKFLAAEIVVVQGAQHIPLAASQFIQPPILLGGVAHLKGLTSGIVELDIVRMHGGGSVIGSFIWNGVTGDMVWVLQPSVTFDQPDDGIRFDFSQIGVGAGEISGMLWLKGAA